MYLPRFYTLAAKGLLLCLVLCFSACNKPSQPNTATEESATQEDELLPFAKNNSVYPPKDIYKGTFFEGNYDYPTEVPTRTYPWEGVLQGKPITKENAAAYIEAVRDFIAPDMQVFVDSTAYWQESPNRKRWYNMAWTGQAYPKTGWDGLETISGSMTGQVIKNDVFKDYGFERPMQNHALVYYNDVAALTLQELWKSQDSTGFSPKYTTAAAQFPQSAVIIKAAGTTASAEEWEVLEGAGTFNIYREMAFGPNKGKGPVLQELTWIQFDIIVKDTVAAPETGWVFATFVYDSQSSGKTTFDRMTLLGVSWGNDPSRMKGTEELVETYLNPNAPAYTQRTIGYGGRLSGPIDVALVGGITATGEADSITVLGKGVKPAERFLHFTASSCLSCHGTASWPAQNDFYPSPNPQHLLVFSDTLYNPASEEWNNYFQNRSGVEIMPNSEGYDSSRMALDYDLYMQFALNNSLLGQKDKGLETVSPRLKKRSK
jgi:hypothetical protein